MFPDILLLENTFIQFYFSLCAFTQSFFKNNVKFFPCLTTESNFKPDKAIFTLKQYLTHAVYSIPCGDCEKVYLGQTKRQFCTRLKEHQRAVSNFNSSKSALAEHVCETSHNIAWEDSKIITTNNRYGQRLCLEAWHINASPCALNRDDGSHLPKSIYILLVDDVTLTAYKVVSFNIRPPLMKTLDRSVETLGRECNLCVVISFI